MSLLALHAGTAQVTAVVVDPRGRIVASASQEHAQHVPQPGWVEHGPEEIWQATLGATRQVLGEADASELTAIGITGRRDTLVLWDRETLGSPRAAIAAPDRRTTEICERLRAEGHGDRVAELTGLGLDPRSSGPRLSWLAEHEPHTWALVGSGRYAVGGVGSYLVARMTRGTWHVTDVSEAGRTTLLDLGSGAWSDELCGVFGVPRDALPDLVPSWGEVARSEPRAFVGLDLPVAGVAGDQQAALFGQACFAVGDTACTVDTDPSDASVLANTGATLVRLGADLLPTAAWRSPGGELSYALEGRTTGPDGTVRAVRELARTVPQVTSVRVGGDAAADDAVCQVLADGAGLPVERPATLRASVLGAALLAGLGTGVWESMDELRGTWELDRRFLPGVATA